MNRNSYDYNSLLKQNYIIKILQNSLAYQGKRPNGVTYLDDAHKDYVKEICRLIKPMALIKGDNREIMRKVRIDRNRDGGYVMIDPGNKGGIAYSFGLSDSVSWDSEMALRGYHVFQYDGTISAQPAIGPNLHWYRYNISGDYNCRPGYKNIETIIKELGHEKEDSIILQMDIENAEWDVFLNTTPEILGKFSQIIVEMHTITDFSAKNKQKHLEVLEKIYKTHQSVHYHINNCGTVAVLPSCSIGSVIEVTFVRRFGNNFMPDYAEYPVDSLDYPNNPTWPDIYIGNLEILLSNTNSVLDEHAQSGQSALTATHWPIIVGYYADKENPFPSRRQKFLIALCKPFVKIFASPEYYIKLCLDPSDAFASTKNPFMIMWRWLLEWIGPAPKRTSYKIVPWAQYAETSLTKS